MRIANLALALLAALAAACSSMDTQDTKLPMQVPTNTICYLEVVTPDVDAACRVYAASYGWSFGQPVPELGGGRVADLDDGSVCAVRGPLRPDEGPLTRAYVRVADLDAAVAAAEAAGAIVALRSMEIAGRGSIAIVLNGGIEQGFWQTG